MCYVRHLLNEMSVNYINPVDNYTMLFLNDMEKASRNHRQG